MTSLGLLQEVSLNLFENKMRLNLYHEDALNKETSEPLENDADETSKYLQGYLHRRLRTSGSISGTSTVSISGSVGPRTGRA